MKLLNKYYHWVITKRVEKGLTPIIPSDIMRKTFPHHNYINMGVVTTMQCQGEGTSALCEVRTVHAVLTTPNDDSMPKWTNQEIDLPTILSLRDLALKFEWHNKEDSLKFMTAVISTSVRW